MIRLAKRYANATNANAISTNTFRSTKIKRKTQGHRKQAAGSYYYKTKPKLDKEVGGGFCPK